MTRRRTVKGVTKSDVEAAKNDPYLSLVYRAKSKADIVAMVDQMGITDPQHKAAMVGLATLAWIVLRRLA
jgi:hypothetical protein